MSSEGACERERRTAADCNKSTARERERERESDRVTEGKREGDCRATSREQDNCVRWDKVINECGCHPCF